jgi:hypothetical protein
MFPYAESKDFDTRWFVPFLPKAEMTLVGGAVMTKNGKGFGGLNWLAERYSDESDPAGKLPYLQAYLKLLEGVLLARFGADFLKLDPLIELQSFLAQIDNGETVEIFTPRKGTGRPPTPLEKLIKWATASALITVLMERYRYAENRAAKAVAAEFRKKGIPLPGTKGAQSPDWKQLQSWRDDLLRGKKGDFALATYDDTRKDAEPFETDTELLRGLLEMDSRVVVKSLVVKVKRKRSIAPTD